MTNTFPISSSSLPLIELLSIGGYRVYSTVRGISPDHAAEPYAGVNLCHYVGDSPAHVAACRSALAEAFGTTPSRLIIPRQTHSTRVLSISSSIPSPEQCEDVDAVVSSITDIITGVSTADCVPLMMVDPVASVSAAVHAGWRGAAAGIASRALEAMTALGATPGDIRAVMGPSICADCFEVGPEVAARFPAECVITEGYPRPHVSLQNALSRELLSAGLHAGNIAPFSTDLCTRCHPSVFFSARRLGVASGRVFTFIVPPALGPRKF